ncbi:hypothetical protein ES703_19883 [subsurface metagenome]
MRDEPITVPPTVQDKYPHMMPADIIIWTRYLKTNPFPQARISYDLHVGTPAGPLDGLTPEYQEMALALSTKRIDAVVYETRRTGIVEVKPYAGSGAIGQVLTYRLLYIREFPGSPQPIAMILTDYPQRDTPWLCNQLNIVLITCPPD